MSSWNPMEDEGEEIQEPVGARTPQEAPQNQITWELPETEPQPENLHEISSGPLHIYYSVVAWCSYGAPNRGRRCCL